MKKYEINNSLLIITFLLLAANSQSPLGKGNQQLNAGIGFSGWGIPVYVGLDFGVHQDISLGYRRFNQIL